MILEINGKTIETVIPPINEELAIEMLSPGDTSTRIQELFIVKSGKRDRYDITYYDVKNNNHRVLASVLIQDGVGLALNK